MAAGELVPLVLLARYTTYAGTGDFLTIAMDVTEYETAIVNVWRGKLVGSTPTIAFLFQESSDQVNWSTCTGGTSFDPGEELEVQKSVTLAKRWFRIKITLGGVNTQTVATCWAVGFLEQRLS